MSENKSWYSNIPYLEKDIEELDFLKHKTSVGILTKQLSVDNLKI